MMTRRDVATLAFKLFALWQILNGIQVLATLIGLFIDAVIKNGWRSSMDAPHSWGDIISVAFVPTAILALAGILLWWKAKPLAKRIFPNEESLVEPNVAKTSYQNWLGMGICLMGLWLLVTGILTLAIFLVQRPAIARRYRMEPQPLWSDLDFWGFIIKLVVGLCLVLGSRGLSRLLWKIRHGGLKDTTEPSDA